METTTGLPISQESADALPVAVGVAATCIGVVCSLYTCCCHVQGRLKGHTHAVAACAAAVAGIVAAGQLASVLSGTSSSQGNPGGRAEAPHLGDPQGRCAGDDPGLTCQ